MTEPKARYRIIADDDSARGWATALRTADSSGKKIASVMKYAFAGISVGAFASAIKGAIEFGDEIGKASTKAGLGAPLVSELAAAVKQLGDIELPSLSTALKFMQVNISKAREDNDKYGDTFRALGIDLQSFLNLAPDKQFEVIAEAISQLRNVEDRARAATEIFGKAGADMLPAFENGARGIREAREEARRLGHTMSDEAVKALQEGDDAIKTLTASWDAFIRSIAVGSVNIAKAVGLIDGDHMSAEVEKINKAIDRTNGLIDELTLKRSRAGTFRLSDEAVAGQRVGSSRAGAGQDIAQLRATLAALKKQLTEIEEARKRAIDGTASGTKPPGYGAGDASSSGGFSDDDRERIRNAEEWLTIVYETETGAADLADTNKWIADSFEDMQEPILDTTDALSVFADEAARNMQSSFADFLFDPFEDGLDGMLTGFIDVVRRMIAEAAAAQIFESLGGSDLLGSVLGSLFGAASSSSGGSAGSTALATGTNFVPYDGFQATLHKGEAVIPAKYNPGAGGGNVSVSPVYNIDARGATMELTRALPEVLRQNNEQLKADIITGLRRGKYKV